MVLDTSEDDGQQNSNAHGHGAESSHARELVKCTGQGDEEANYCSHNLTNIVKTSDN
jgi:hypothetical protein